MARDIATKFNNSYACEVFKLPEPMIVEEVAVVPGVDGRKMSKSYGNTLCMFWPEKRLRKAIMAIVTDSSPVEAPKNTEQTLFQLWSLFATKAEREALFARAAAGGMGYGEVKKDLAERAIAYFAPMRARREQLAQQKSLVEDVLADGVKRARVLATPVFEAARAAAGVGRAK
jgi:tryptophanyl-tRNA synthetase